MPDIQTVRAADAASLAPFDAIIDVRSPSEFAEDHVPGAISLPVLDDEERARVGTIYVQDSPFRARRIGGALPGLWKNHGDVYFIRPNPTAALAPVARLFEPNSGRVMTVSSTEPCLQLYTGVSLDGTLTGKFGRRYAQYGAVCLECEGYPNGANAPHLGNIILRSGAIYRQTTVHQFSTA